MKRVSVHLVVTGVLLVVLSFLLLDSVIPARAADHAYCNYAGCAVSCNGTNCYCDEFTATYVDCLCETGDLFKYKYCPV